MPPKKQLIAKLQDEITIIETHKCVHVFLCCWVKASNVKALKMFAIHTVSYKKPLTRQ